MEESHGNGEEERVENQRLLASQGVSSSSSAHVEAFEVEGLTRTTMRRSFRRRANDIWRKVAHIFSSHPKLLWVLASTEVWERFSYYGMRALLVLYLTKELLRPDVIGDVGGLTFLARSFGSKAIVSDAGDDPEAIDARDKAIQAFASQLYGYYTAFVYLTPVAGGILADQIFGQHAMIITGSLLMALGHGLLSTHATFLVGLLFIILGNGCFKPNISARVGKLYDKDASVEAAPLKKTEQKTDLKGHAKGHNARDEAFSIFYCAINLGAFIAPLVVGSIRSSLGYGWAFSAAGIGMVIGLVVYVAGTHVLERRKRKFSYDVLPLSTPAAGFPRDRNTSLGGIMEGDNGLSLGSPTGHGAERPNSEIRSRSSTNSEGGDMMEVDLGGAGDQKTVQTPNGDLYTSPGDPHQPPADLAPAKSDSSNISLEKSQESSLGGGLGEVGGHGGGYTSEDLPRIAALVGVCLMAVCFWAVFEQQGNTLALYGDHSVNRRVVIGHHLVCSIPTEYIQSINPIFILIFTPFVNTLWRKQSQRNCEPKPLTKMSIGCFLLGLGYSLLCFAETVRSPESGDKVSILWMVAAIALATLGELYLSPVGLSFVSMVAPSYMTSVAIGFWLLASFGGNMLAGQLGALYPYMSHSSFFGLLTVIALCNSAILALLSRPLSKRLAIV